MEVVGNILQWNAQLLLPGFSHRAGSWPPWSPGSSEGIADEPHLFTLTVQQGQQSTTRPCEDPDVQSKMSMFHLDLFIYK